MLPRVLLCADSANLAYWKPIERRGGLLECEKMSAHYATLFRRYWVTVSKVGDRCRSGWPTLRPSRTTVTVNSSAAFPATYRSGSATTTMSC
jgi:hypothetical protein